MTVETATYLDSLSSANPGISDQIPEGDDHLRLIKAVLKSTFPGRGGEEGRAIVKAAGFTPALTEIGATFVSTGTLAVTLAALAGLPDGTFYNFLAKVGTTTLTPNGADTINGTTTFVLTVGQSCEIVKQGTNWVVLAAPYVAPSAASQAEMEAGVLATIRSMSPLLVAQAIAALAAPISGEVLQTVFDTDAGASSASSSHTNVTGSAISITPKSTSSTLFLECDFLATVTAGGAGINTEGAFQLYDYSASALIGVVVYLGVFSGGGTNIQTQAPARCVVAIPNTVLTARLFTLHAHYIIGACTVSANNQVWKITEVKN